ncbi:MAG TPA: TIGR01777 family oxidoreductase [Flavobacterium sp.]
MRVLVTGATGLIGTELVALLSSKNIDVHYLALHSGEIRNQQGISGFLWDPRRGVIDENCLMGVDAIIHLAGAPIAKRWTSSYKQEIIESRTMSAHLLYKVLKSNPHQVKNFISASAIGIYPDSLSEAYTEDNKTVDDSFLGNVVVKWESSVNKFSQIGINVCKIRTGLVLSKKGGVLQELLKPIKMGIGSAYGNGKQWQSWIHVDDLTNMYYEALNQQWKGIYNGTAPNPVTNTTLTKKIAQKLNKPFFMPEVPKIILKWMLGEMHTLLFTSQKVLPQNALQQNFIFQYPEIDGALNDLLQ